MVQISDGTIPRAAEYVVQPAMWNASDILIVLRELTVRLLRAVGVQGTESYAWCSRRTRCHADDAEDGNEGRRATRRFRSDH
jgi:hypothetical protein